MLTAKDKQEIKEMVVDGVTEVIQDVLMPAFKTLARKSDFKQLENKYIDT